MNKDEITIDYSKTARLNLNLFVGVGFGFYIIVKELPPIVLRGNENAPIKISADIGKYKPVKKQVAYIEPTSKGMYDENDMLIDNDCVMFLNYDDAKHYCDILNSQK